MARREPPIRQFDPDGMRRMIARTLQLDGPASWEEAEKLILSRFGPYLSGDGTMRSEIAAYFALGH